MGTIFLFWVLTLPVQTATGQELKTNAPLYLLSYDHGGLILWGTDHFAERLRNGIAWLDRYPDFKLGLDNEACVYDFLAEHEPALLNELKGYLKKYSGRFGIGTCTYGQPLSTFINEESNIRQIAYAIKADQKQLGYTPVVYLMSEHAMHSQIPQILVGFGLQGAIMRTHFMMYGYNPVFPVPIGWWVGLDGSRLPAVPTYPNEGAAFGRTTVDNWFLTRYPGSEVKVSPEDFRRQFVAIQPLLATRADDAGLRKEELLKEYAGKPGYRWILLDELLSIFPKPAVEMKTRPEDFTVRMPWGYCGNEIWNRNRQAEVQVLTAERLAAFEWLFGGTSHERELEHAWKNLLVGQHHDVQIVGLLPDARKYLGASLEASTRVLNSSLRFLAARMKSEGFAQVTVFNPVSWARQEWVETDVTLPKGAGKDLKVLHERHAVPSVLLHADRFSGGDILEARLAFLADLPGLACGSYSVTASDGSRSSVAVDSGNPQANEALVDINRDNLRVLTPFCEARLAPEGGLASLKDRRTGAEWLASDRRNGFFAGRINGTDCESRGRWTLHPASPRAPWIVAREDGFIADIPYTFEIRFGADKPRLDCRVRFHFDGEKIGQLSEDPRDARSPFIHERKLRYKLFPAVNTNAVGVRDLPFAISETTNHYVEGIYWTAVADSRLGLAFFNRGAMGAVRESDGGFSLPLAYAMYYVWGTRMLQGDFNYEFAIEPFLGEGSHADLHRKAIAYNFPMVSSDGPKGSGALGETLQPLRVGSDNIVLSALYPEQGQVYARLYECAGRDGESRLSYQQTNASFSETDLLGRGEHAAKTPTTFHPWQIRTFKVKLTR